MKDNTRIAVYYIATGDYKKMFPEFLESLQNFFPNCQKIVKLISDGLEEYKDYEKGNVKVDLCPRINNYPWPIVTLYKMYHILENQDPTCKYSCYFNGNATINEHNNNIFDLKKITVSYHSFNQKGEKYDPWKAIQLNPKSSAYLENGTYEYIQGGFFFGPSDLVYKMCSDVVKMIKEDSDYRIMAQWHDESYLNKWCVLNSDKVDKKYIMTVFKRDVDKERFVYLRNKKSYDIDKHKIKLVKD